jgi:hypothetical protein
MRTALQQRFVLAINEHQGQQVCKIVKDAFGEYVYSKVEYFSIVVSFKKDQI